MNTPDINHKVKTIAIVNSNHDECEAILSALYEYNFKICIEYCGEAFTNNPDYKSIDALVISLDLPDINTLRLCKKIKEIPDWFTKPIIVIINSEHETVIQNNADLQSTYFIKRPLNYDSIASNLKYLLIDDKSIVKKRQQFTEQRHSKDRRYSTSCFHTIEQITHIGYYVYDPSNSYFYSSEGLFHILEKENMISSLNDLFESMSPLDIKSYQENFENIEDNQDFEPVTFEHLVKVKNNMMKYVSHTLIHTEDNIGDDSTGTIRGSKKVLGIIQDITERYNNEREILHMAYYDILTDLPNRAGFEKNFNSSLSLAENCYNLALIFIDLDNFKTINDTMGHDAGDILLREITQRIHILCNKYKENYSDQDLILSNIVPSRFGGDEFVISIPYNHDITFVENFTRILLDQINMPIKILDQNIRASASIGISSYPNNGDNFLTLLKKADTAMYKSKEKNKNTYTVYTDEMGETISDKLAIESELFDAIRRDELVLFYQPRISLSSGNIESFEALLRWNHPDKGLLMPNDFIDIAEESDLILEITDWVIKRCFNDYNKFFYKHDLSVSMNLSARQFNTNLFASDLFATNKQDMDPSKFEFEITETTLVDNFKKTTSILNILKEKGFKCAIDDFGSGYSSLNYIKNLPIDIIKIDKEFMCNITEPKNSAIIKTIIYLAKELEIKVVAEGLENQDQLLKLLEYNCEEAQGFLISQAVPLKDVMSHKFTSDVVGLSKFIKNYNSNKKIKMVK